MQDVVLLAHGSGGTMSRDLVERRLLSHIANPILSRLDDSAVLDTKGRLAFTTDSYIVDPIFFPGGDIGRLAICGTVNDLSMVGATPIGLSLALILEEGLPFETLDRVMASVHSTCAEASVDVITGDTKVVNRGKADKLFINTAGIGIIPNGVDISGSNARPGDKILLNGSIAEHGIAVMTSREGLTFSSEIQSDCAPLNGIVKDLLEAAGVSVRSLRDPTRGGLATTLNEIAAQSGAGIMIEESAIPIDGNVRAACEMLGLDPLYVANEGKFVAVVAPEGVDAALSTLKQHALGTHATIIGEVIEGKKGKVMMHTRLGPTRPLSMLTGELLPRIC
ncbi:hydrogenase expression/formation protein HypE [Candidatus Bipolaricaulota bacterium]|nr:hydrogenase expression/formation protein HypE [Candidatus Bipolaricaulota bacterium]